MYRIIKIALILVGVLSFILWTQLPSGDDPAAVESGSLTLMFTLMYILLAVAAVMAVLFGVRKLISTPGGLKRAVISVGTLAVIAVIGYALAGEEAAVVEAVGQRNITVTEGTVKNIGMLLNVFFGMLFLAIASMTVLPALLKLTRR